MAIECKGQFRLIPSQGESAFFKFWHHLLTQEEYRALLYNTIGTEAYEKQYFKIREVARQSETHRAHHFELTLGFFRGDDYHTPLHVRQYYVKLIDVVLECKEKTQTLQKSFKRERLYYGTFLEHYKAYQWDASFSPQCYLITPHVLYLENMSLRGFKSVEKYEFFDYDHCKLALVALANFHVTAMRYENELKNQRKPSIESSHRGLFSHENRWWFKYSVTLTKAVLTAITQGKEKGLIKKFSRFVTASIDRYNRKQRSYTATLLHGDLCSNNILFSYDNYDNYYPERCVFVDYQLMTYGPVGLDVLNLIYSNTTASFRARPHMVWDLKTTYSHFFDLAAKRAGLSMSLDYNEFGNICDSFGIFYACRSICEKCVNYIPDFRATNLTYHSPTDYLEYLLEKRVNAIRLFYTYNEAFTRMLEDDLKELRDLLSFY